MKKLVLALLLALLPSLALAQQFPTVPDHTVIGRVGTGSSSGPSQAISFLNFNSLLGNHVLPGTYAGDPQFGMKCNGVDDDSAALQLAVNTADANLAWPVYIPAGVCPIAHNVFLNKTSAPGIATVPGMKLVGQGRGVTILDTRVANDYAISVNPAWKAAHQALFGIAAQTTGGTLASNTYFVQISVQTPTGEVAVTLPKSIAVTGSTGSISITLPPITQGYGYNIRLDTTSTPTHYALVNGGNAFNVGGGQTVTMTAIAFSNGPVSNAVQAAWQEASISNLSITNSTGTTNASGIEYFKVGYSDLTNVYMHGLTGDGFGLQAYTGDVDGSFNVGIHRSKFDTIAGTCVNAAGNVLETTSFTVDDLSEFNVCGTLPTNLNTPVTISSINNGATAIVITSGSHGLLAGDQVAFSVSGMTLASTWYRVGSTVTGNSFNLVDLNGNAVNTTSLGSFASGTVSLSWRPPQIKGGALAGGGGCLAWTGLLGTLRNTNFTQCNNFSFYATEVGSSDNLTIENVDLENTAGVGAYIAGLLGGTLKNFECLSTVGDGSTIACVQLGTGMASGGVENFLIDVGKVRTNVTPSIGFEQFQNTNIGATFQDTNRVRNITWQSFDASGQTRFSGFRFDPIPGQAKFSISAANTAKLLPSGAGSSLPLHPQVNGEWVPYQVPSAGVTGAVTGGLSSTTSYNCYAYNSASTSSPYSISFACNSNATAIEANGYTVDSTNFSHVFVGTATTDVSGNFQSSGAQTTWYPVAGGNVTINTGTPLGVAVYVNGTNIGSTAAGTNGQLLLGVTGALANWGLMSGDATISNTGVLTLASTITAAGPIGSGTLIPVITYDAKGRLTTVTTTALTPPIGNVTGVAAGWATWGATPSSANLRAVMTDETGTGLLYFQGGDIGTPSAGVGTNLTALNASNLGSGTVAAARGGAGTITGALKGSGAGVVTQAACADLSNGAASCSTDTTNAANISSGSLSPARLSLGQLVNSTGADVSLSNVSNYFDGPSVAQGTTGTWFASGTVTVTGASSDNIFCKLWDGTTIVASAETSIISALNYSISLSGFLATPAANLRISCRDVVGTTGKILFNATTNGKDSTLSAFRIN